MRGQGERADVVAGRYRIVERLGQGGMGRVFVAHDDVLGRTVALKLLREDLARSDELVSRFRREAQAAASLSHENVVRVFDSNRGDDGVPYISMEYVRGGTLYERLKREGPLEPREAARIARGVAYALDAAHEGGIVHRDIKPHNVFLTERGEVKVGDFGIARAANATAMTQTSLVLGTARYISPEVAAGEPASPKSDLYSLGVVLYEMLTGRAPFEAENPIAVAMRHVNDDPVPPKVLAPAVPGDLDAATMRLLRKNPEERPASALDAASMIEGALDPTRPTSLDADTPTGRMAGAGHPGDGDGRLRSSRRKKVAAGVFCAALLAAASPAALSALGGGPLERASSLWGGGESGPPPRAASPAGGANAAAPEPPAVTPQPGVVARTGGGPAPAAGQAQTPAPADQYQYAPQYEYEPDEGPEPAAPPTSAPLPEADSPPSPAREPEAELPEPPRPTAPSVDPENTPPVLGPDGGSTQEGPTPTDPSPNSPSSKVRQTSADKVVEDVQRQVEAQVQDIAPGFSFDEQKPRGEKNGRKVKAGRTTHGRGRDR